MKRNLRRFFYKRKRTSITLEDLKTIFKYIRKNDRVVIEINNEVFIITHDVVELGVIDGEWTHVVMRKRLNSVIVCEGNRDYLNDTINGWHGDLKKLYDDGLNNPLPIIRYTDDAAFTFYG